MAASSCHFSPTSFAQIPQYACQPLTPHPHRGQSVVPDSFLSDTNTLLSLPTDQGMSLPALETPEAAPLPGSDQLPFLASSSPQNSDYAHNNNTSAQAHCTTDAPESREFEEIDLDPYPLLVTSPDLASLNDLLLNEDNFMTDRPGLSSSPGDGREQPATQNETPLPSQSDSSDIPEDLFEIGYRDTNGEWRCNFDGCLSTRVFKRACDLRKHWYRHRRDFKCSYTGCNMGFATAKDMRRHQASHNPGIQCTAAGCDRTFSRAGMLAFMSLVFFLVPFLHRRIH